MILQSLETRIDILVMKMDRLIELIGRERVLDDMDQSFTTEEAAAFLKVHKQELLRYAKSGLPFYNDMGKGFKFLKKDLVAFREKFREPHQLQRDVSSFVSPTARVRRSA